MLSLPTQIIISYWKLNKFKYEERRLLQSAVLAMDSDPGIASQKLQTNLDAIEKMFKEMKYKS
jgi:hypothetical protein